MTDQNTTPAETEKPLSPYERACLPFKLWGDEFNKLPETARVNHNDVGRRVKYLAPDGTVQIGRLQAYDNEHGGIGVVSPATLISRYRLRRVDDTPPRIVAKVEFTRERATLLLKYLIKSSIEVDEDEGETLRDVMEPYWKVREDLVFELQRALGS